MQRKLHPQLKTWFDSRCLNPTPSCFLDPKNPIEMLKHAALMCLSITEMEKDNHGPLVELFQSTIGKAEGEPWCLSFIQSCVAYVESFGFSSCLFPSEHCLTVWANSLCRRPIEPIVGDIVIYQMGNTTKGHAEIITNVFLNSFQTIGGNTSSGSEIERNGDGIYSKIRSRHTSDKFKTLGFLRIF